MARIALDAMGGDFAPQQTVLGALDAVGRGVDVVLVGDEPVLSRVLAEVGGTLPIVHAPETIGMADDPAAAIREKKGASVTVCARLVADGEAEGMVSAGSTGAAMAAAAIVIGRVKGVSRPAIATIFPLGTPTVVLDAGANVEVKPENLVQFAVMGSVVAEIYLGREEPTVGLLNIGEEEGKGRDLEREAHALMRQRTIRFVGNVEGRDLGRGIADVFVTDGFTGNVLLKTAEGVARAVGRFVLEGLAAETDPAVQEAAAIILPKLMALRERFDPEAYGGAHLVGVKGTVVIAHGSSTRRAIANALTLASEGIHLALWGLFKKVVIADRLALFVDKGFAAPAFATPAELVVAVYFFAFQIYCDFSGYTDIAIGAFKFFGFNLAPNFQRPYLSRSVPEFWGRRWHISLGSWFRDYLFIPLGGSRVPLWRTLINLMVVFTVSGLWHAGLVGSAVSLPFVVWGALNGLYQVVSVGTRGLREGVARRLPWLRRLSAIQGIGVVQGLVTFHLITLGWIFFRAASIRDAWAVMLRIGLNAARLPMLFSFYRYRDFEFITSIALILVLLLLETIDERKPMWQRLQSAPPYIRWGYGYLLAVVLIVLGKWGAATFIYMQF